MLLAQFRSPIILIQVAAAGLSLFIPFLPLLPKPIHLMSLLTDLPEMAIANGDLDHELADQPRRWEVLDIRDFMIVFGTISSLFDFATVGVLLEVLHGTASHFRTGWFMESVLSALVIVLVIFTRKRIFAIRPVRALVASTSLVGGATLVLPSTLPGAVLRFHTQRPCSTWRWGRSSPSLCRFGGDHHAVLFSIKGRMVGARYVNNQRNSMTGQS